MRNDLTPPARSSGRWGPLVPAGFDGAEPDWRPSRKRVGGAVCRPSGLTRTASVSDVRAARRARPRFAWSLTSVFALASTAVFAAAPASLVPVSDAPA